MLVFLTFGYKLWDWFSGILSCLVLFIGISLRGMHEVLNNRYDKTLKAVDVMGNRTPHPVFCWNVWISHTEKRHCLWELTRLVANSNSCWRGPVERMSFVHIECGCVCPGWRILAEKKSSLTGWNNAFVFTISKWRRMRAKISSYIYV